MALGIGYGLPFVAQHGTYPYKTQWAAAREGAKGAGASVEDENAGTGSCLVARGQDVYTDGLPFTPSLLIVPQFYKEGNLYQDVPPFVAEDLTMRFTVSRNTTATRVNSSGLIQSVVSGVPRIDWLGQSCPGLLVEASGQNGILNSADTTTNWPVGANLSSGAIDVIGVSGINLTVAVSGSGIGFAAGRIVRSSNNVALASGSTYTISFFVKRTGTHTIGGYYALITGAASGDLGAGFDVSGSFSSGSIFNTAGTTNRIRRVEQWGTDVYRCSETFTMTASGTLTNFFLAPVAGVTSSNNSTVGTQLGFAAPQIELGVFPTSFIPTTTAAVSRAADVISASGALVSGLIGQTEGTMYVEVDVRILGDGRFASVSDGTTNNRIQCRFNVVNNGVDFVVVVSGASVGFSISNSSHPSFPATISAGTYKIALGYKQNDYVVAMNGVAYTPTVTTRNVPLNFSKVTLGADVSDLNQFNNRIRAAALYTTRLSNAQLAELTRL